MDTAGGAAGDAPGIAEALATLAWRQAKPVENVLDVNAAWRRFAARELVATAWRKLDRPPVRVDEKRPR